MVYEQKSVYQGSSLYKGDGIYKSPSSASSIDAMTLRFKFSQSGYSPVSAGVGTGGTWKQVSSSPNVWDWTRTNSNWDSSFSSAFTADDNQVEIIDCGNTDGVTSMDSMFLLCSQLISICLFSTKNVTAFKSIFNSCTKLNSIPLFDTGKMANVSGAFAFTRLVASGSLALYNQMSTQATPPSDTRNCFLQCGQNTTTGAAELAQIPSSWGGTGA